MRLIGSVFVYNEVSLQTHGYVNYSPLGDLNPIISIFDKHFVDEIFISARLQSHNAGPSEYVLKILRDLNVSTPITYSGGIRTIPDVRLCLESGVDRVGVNTSLFDLNSFNEIVSYIGVQGVVAVVPFANVGGSFYVFNCKTRSFDVTVSTLVKALSNKIEILLIDMKSDGNSCGFSNKIFDVLSDRELIIQGGVINEITELQENKNNKISGIAIENRLLWSECATQKFRKDTPLFIKR